MDAANSRTDFASHRIEGFAHAAVDAGRDGRFNVPLTSHIVGNLWMGGCIGGVRLGDEFEHVVSLYPWERYRISNSTSRVEYRLYDSATGIPSPGELRDIVDHVNTMRAGGKTLVHCQAGLNRSGLVCALALIHGPERMAPADAIALLRKQRCPVVLCNETFERLVLSEERS